MQNKLAKYTPLYSTNDKIFCVILMLYLLCYKKNFTRLFIISIYVCGLLDQSYHLSITIFYYHFTIVFNTTKSKEIVEKIWNVKVKEGRLGYEMIGGNPQREFSLKLDRLPEEVPTEVMEAYLGKYVKNPKMEITVRDLSEHGLGKVEIGEATVTHKGLRRAIPRMVWVGPGVRACVTSMTKKPWDSYKVLCSLCKGEGHKAWDCPKQTNCFRCKAATHTSADCPYCETCRKYLSEGCTANQNSTKETDEDKNVNTQDANGKPEKADQQERPPRQKEQPKQPKPAPKVTTKKAKNKKAKSKAKPAAAEGQITAATTGSENEDESEIECMDEVEFMDEEDRSSMWRWGRIESMLTQTPTLQQHPRKKNRTVRESPNTPY